MPDKEPSSPQQQTLTLQQALELAVEHHQAGDLPKAENIYQQILKADPNHVKALHLLGVIAFQGGDNEKAIELIEKALAIKPDYAEVHYNLGLVYQAQGRLAEAVCSYEKTVKL